MLNTLHRYKASEEETENFTFHPADVAHNDKHLFEAVTEGVAEADKKLFFVQCHGFESGTSGGTPDLLISDGTPEKQLWSKTLFDNLKIDTFKIEIFKNSALKLGATTNVQGKFLRSLNLPFLHLEMSLSLREKLSENEALIDKLSEGLLKTARIYADSLKK